MISNRALQGQPTLPYTDNILLAGQDVFATLTFLDKNGVPVAPTALTLEITDLTNGQTMLGPTVLSPTGGTSPVMYSIFATSMTIQVPASIMVMTYPNQGSQICELVWTAKAVDSVTSTAFQFKKVDIISLCSVATASGN